MNFQASGTSTITWAVTAGALPAGLALSTTGALTGTPTAVGTSNFTVTATNGVGADSLPCQIQVGLLPTITQVFPSDVPMGGTISIAGTGFSSTASDNTVTIDGHAALVRTASATRLQVEIPHGLSSGNVQVVVQVQTGSGAQQCGPFAYVADIVRVVKFCNLHALGLQDGTSWVNAFVDLDTALASLLAGEELWIAEGDYSLVVSHTVPTGAILCGGFSTFEGGLDARDLLAWPTRITCSLASTAHMLVCNAGCILDGLQIHHLGCCAIQVLGGVVSLRNLVFDHCNATRGGCVLLDAGELHCTLCRVTNCVQSTGGAIHSAVATTIIELDRCVCDANLCSVGGAVVHTAGRLLAHTCVFLHNTCSLSGGALYCEGIGNLLEFCSFQDNVAGLLGESVCIATGTVRNCVFGGEVSLLVSHIAKLAGTVDIAHCLIEAGGIGGLLGGLGNLLGLVPGCVDVHDLLGLDGVCGTRDDGLLPAPGSALLDAADGTGAPAMDITGTPRPQGGGFDIGAYER